MFEFLRELREVEQDFENSLLFLLSKYYRYNDMMLAAFVKPVKDKKGIETHPMPRVFTMNIDTHVLKMYSAYYRRTDIFHPDNLPKRLQGRDVLTIRDVMPLDKFRDSDHREILNQGGMEYQMTLYFYADGDCIAQLGIFHTAEQGDFSRKEVRIFETLVPMIAQEYRSRRILQHARQRQSFLQNTYDRLPIGVVLLDAKMGFIRANDLALEYCEDISQKVYPSGGLISAEESLDPEVRAVRRVVLYVGSNIALDKADGQDVVVRVGEDTEYLCKLDSFIFYSDIAEIESVNVLYIIRYKLRTKDEKKLITDKYDLTKRELEVIDLIEKGCSNKEIASRLFISSHTVKTHIMNIFKKTEVTSRTALMHKLKGTHEE